MSLFKPRIRLYILLISVTLSLGVYLFWTFAIPQGSFRTIRLTQTFALIATGYLYLALLASPLIKAFPSLPFSGKYIQARRAVGVSAFYFAFLHGYNAFFNLLGGFSGLMFLNGRYILAITLSFTALCILTLMAATSFDSMIRRLSFPRWKLLHRFVYLAGMLILIHALLLGSHFSDLSGLIPQIFFVALSFLLFLEALRLDAFLARRFSLTLRFGLVTFFVTSLILTATIVLLLPTQTAISFGIHQQHIQLAQALQNNRSLSSFSANIPGLRGDPTKRYTVDIETPNEILPNQPVTINFHVFDAANGNPVQFFQKNYDKIMHLIIVDDSLTYFSHIHPEQNKATLSVETTFPENGLYRLYVDFQPLGAIEQQMAFTVPVGDGIAKKANFQQDKVLEKTFGNYRVVLKYDNPLLASKLTNGEQQLTFSIKDATNKPVTTLKPYLAAFGHLVMINQKTHEYLHVHPAALSIPSPDTNGGPDVSFIPLGLYGPIKPGIYRIFAQFNPDDTLITADFTITLQ